MQDIYTAKLNYIYQSNDDLEFFFFLQNVNGIIDIIIVIKAIIIMTVYMYNFCNSWKTLEFAFQCRMIYVMCILQSRKKI